MQQSGGEEHHQDWVKLKNKQPGGTISLIYHIMIVPSSAWAPVEVKNVPITVHLRL